MRDIKWAQQSILNKIGWHFLYVHVKITLANPNCIQRNNTSKNEQYPIGKRKPEWRSGSGFRGSECHIFPIFVSFSSILQLKKYLFFSWKNKKNKKKESIWSGFSVNFFKLKCNFNTSIRIQVRILSMDLDSDPVTLMNMYLRGSGHAIL